MAIKREVMMANWTLYNCTVNEVGPASDGSETLEPVIYINLTATNNALKNTWFYANNAIKNELLDVGIAALSGHKHVEAGVEPPNPKNTPYTAVDRIYLLST
jgi:hypothetical protein